MLGAWIGAGASLVGLTASWLVHTKVKAFLPEDTPAPGRKRHLRPTPMAGIVPALVGAIACAAAGLPALAGGTGVAALVGAIDDARKSSGQDGIGWRPKAIGLLIAAVLALADVPDKGSLATWALLLSFAFVVTNALNFLDNQNGVATAVGGVGLLLIARGQPESLATTLAACWLPFLVFNWPRARMFLGDAGAYALGLSCAVLALRGAGPAPFDVRLVIAPLLVPLIDFVQVVTARLVLGYAPWIGDRRHVTHLLLIAGVPRPALAPVLTACAVGLWAIARAL